MTPPIEIVLRNNDPIDHEWIVGDAQVPPQVLVRRAAPVPVAVVHRVDPETRLLLGAAVLGTGRASRLYRSVRERKLAASVTAYNYTPTDVGVFVSAVR